MREQGQTVMRTAIQINEPELLWLNHTVLFQV